MQKLLPPDTICRFKSLKCNLNGKFNYEKKNSKHSFSKTCIDKEKKSKFEVDMVHFKWRRKQKTVAGRRLTPKSSKIMSKSSDFGGCKKSAECCNDAKLNNSKCTMTKSNTSKNSGQSFTELIKTRDDTTVQITVHQDDDYELTADPSVNVFENRKSAAPAAAAANASSDNPSKNGINLNSNITTTTAATTTTTMAKNVRKMRAAAAQAVPRNTTSEIEIATLIKQYQQNKSNSVDCGKDGGKSLPDSGSQPLAEETCDNQLKAAKAKMAATAVAWGNKTWDTAFQ